MNRNSIAIAFVAFPLNICWAQISFPPVKNAAMVLDFAAHSSCRSYPWKHRQGVAPIGFTKGVALTYAKSYCELKENKEGPVQVNTRILGKPSYDVLAFYKPFVSLPIMTSLQRLETIYALTLGLGMMESSGRTTISAPYDKANPNPDSETGEAGLYQTSHDSMKSDASLTYLTAYYKSNPEACLLPIFMEGIHTKITSAIGNGEGAEFQQFTKQCPAFATEYAAIMLRVNRHHYGTINQRSVEYNDTCASMFRQIENIVDCQ